MCMIQIIESILRSTTLVVDSCDNISALRWASIHPEEVKSQCKQADIISCLSNVYHSIDFEIPLVHVYGHHNSGKLVSIVTPLESLNVWLDTLAEHIISSFLLLAENRTTIEAGLSYPYRLPIVFICGVPVHSNLAHYIVYEISKLRILLYWFDSNLTHMAYWDRIYPTSFKR